MSCLPFNRKFLPKGKKKQPEERKQSLEPDSDLTKIFLKLNKQFKITMINISVEKIYDMQKTPGSYKQRDGNSKKKSKGNVRNQNTLTK